MPGRALIKEADVVVNSNKKTYKVLLNVVSTRYQRYWISSTCDVIYFQIHYLNLHVKPPVLYITDYLS